MTGKKVLPLSANFHSAEGISKLTYNYWQVPLLHNREAPKMRFSLRDLMWATALVAMGVAWWMDNQAKNTAIAHSHRLHKNLSFARQWHYYRKNINLTGFMATPTGEPDWAVLEEPLVQP